MSARRTLYALAGGVLGLGAPAGLLMIRLRRGGLSVRSAIQELKADRETYFYTATSTSVAFALFGGTLGHYADRLAQLATTDPLTGLLNARAFRERLRHELGRAARYHEPLSCLVVDVDALKHVNDQYGHAAGDAALQSVAAVIRSGLRQIDFGARLGGDEFGMLAPRTSVESAVVLAGRLRALLAESRGTGERTTISIGIASLVPSQAEQTAALSLMAAADNALYQAKRAGGNCAVAAPDKADH